MYFPFQLSVIILFLLVSFMCLFETTMFLYDRTSILLNKYMFTHILSILRKVTLLQHSTMYCTGCVVLAVALAIQAAQLMYALAPFMSDYGKNSAFLSLKSLRQVNVIGLIFPT